MSIRKVIKLTRAQKIALQTFLTKNKWSVAVQSEPFRIGKQEFVQLTEGNRKDCLTWLPEERRWKSPA